MPKTSQIDQRLAAQLSHRQVETLDRIDKIQRSINRVFADLQTKLLGVITGEYSDRARQFAFGELIKLAIKDTKSTLLNRLMEHYAWSHKSSVEAIMAAVPLAYLASRIPPESKAAFEAMHHPNLGAFLNVSYGTFSVSLEEIDESDPFNLNIPIKPLGEVKLTDEEYADLVKRVVFPAPGPMQVLKALKTSDWEARLDSLSSNITDKQIAFDTLVKGFSDGENIAQVKKKLEPLVGGIKASAQRIARTEGMRVAEDVQRKSWEGLGDMMIGAQIIAVLDENTRPEHATRNGQIYYRNPRGNQKSIDQLPDLPDQPNCRCMSSPVLALPKELENDPAIREAFKQVEKTGTGDAETHNKWFAAADPVRRKKVVGIKRYNEVEKLVDREPQWSDFVSEDGSLLTMKELRDESVIQRTARKQLIDQQIAKRGRAIRELSRDGFEWPRAKPKKPKASSFAFGKPVAFLSGLKNNPLYRSPKLEKLLKDTVNFLGETQPPLEFSVLFNANSSHLPETRVIDGKPIIVVGPRFFKNYNRSQQQMVIAHEMEHISDITRIGVPGMVKLYQRSPATVELSVQNRAMGKIMMAYERAGKKVPKEILELHDFYLYNGNPSWHDKLLQEWK